MTTIDSKYKYFFDSIVISKKMRTSLLAARVLILPLLVTSAQAGEVSLAWNPSISSSVGGYRVYHGQISGDYTSSQDVGNKLTHTVKGLQDGAVYYFAVTAYDLTKTVESNFSNEVSSLVENTYSLTVGKAGTGSGTVTGTGINCGSDCSELYTAGMTVTLTAAAAAGSSFNGWIGDCSGTATTCLLAMSAARNLTATFNSASASAFALTVDKAGTGSGTVTGSGINCGTDCSELYTAGMTVTLTAAAAAGSIFNGWSGSCLGAGACHLTMNAVRNVAATFRLETPKKTQTVGLYAPATGIFFLKNSHASGAADFTFRYGPANSGWIPLVGDWDGDGIQTVGLYAPTIGIFFLRNSHASGAVDFTFRYGPANSGWIPLLGDWDELNQ